MKTHSKTGRAARRIRGFGAAVLASLALGACVPVAGPSTGGDFAAGPAAVNPGNQPSPGFGPNPGYGPNPGFGTGNGWWSAPPGFQLSFHYTSSEGAFSAGVLSPGSSDWYLVYDDGSRIGWGQMGADGVLRGTWARAGGLVACPLPVPPPDGLAARGFQFHQPLSVWGTFEAAFQAGQGGSSFTGSWGGCGIPLGVPWSGQAG